MRRVLNMNTKTAKQLNKVQFTALIPVSPFIAALASCLLFVCSEALAKSSRGNVISRCFVSGLGASDTSFAEEFTVYSSPAKSNAGVVSASLIRVHHVGSPSVERKKKDFPVKILETQGSQPKLVVEFPSGSFSEDYLKFEMLKRPNNLSLTFDLDWGSHRYFCRTWN